jgi:Serine dehydrogenase proteinase
MPRNTRRLPNRPVPGAAPPRPAAPMAAPLAAPISSTSAAAPGSDKVRLASLIDDIETQRNSKVLVYWIGDAGRVSTGAVLTLFDQLEAIGPTERIDLLLSTTGGDADVPWRIVSLCREYCTRLSVLVPYRALSAGTTICLGADEIVMTPLGSLGPIDPSRTHPLLPRVAGANEAEPVSVQDMRHAMQFVREAGGASMTYTPEAMAAIYTALFDKIHPLAIGAIEQSYALAKLVARMCLETHMDSVADEAEIRRIVDRLCDDYKSHGFAIDRGEARAIGLKVVNADPALATTLGEIVKLYLARQFLPGGPPGSSTKTVVGHIAWLDSAKLNYRVEASFKVLPDGKLEIQGDAWVAY